MELTAIIACIFLLGMSKGGFPVGPLVLPLLILAWPDQVEPAKEVVAFMLPVLCATDICAVYAYRRHIQWRKIVPLIPGSLIGVALGSLCFISENAAVIAVSDRFLKIMIGVIGILFVLYRVGRKWLSRQLPQVNADGWMVAGCFGSAAGLTSTLAHAAGPVAQMYFLVNALPKMEFAATIAGFFFGLNLVKMVPFILLGRLDTSAFALAFKMLPVVPVGVATGYLLVRRMKGTWYIAFIHGVLFITACTLIAKAVLE
jgi:uncharacterized membrane protein YfcA